MFEKKITLSDNDTKEMTAVLKFPKKWNQQKPSSLTVDEEIYILSGSININNIQLDEGSYSYLPAYYPR